MKGRILLIPFVLLALYLVVGGACVVVPSGHVGVVRTLGAVQSEEFGEGFHFKKPFLDKVHKMDIRLTAASSKASAASKDLQVVQTQVTMQYSLVGPASPDIYQKIGKREVVSLTLIEPAIQESVKAVTAKYTAEQLVTKRAEVKAQIQEAIKNFVVVTLVEKGLPGNALEIANIAITDFDFSPEFNRAIEMKVKAEQEALQAKNEKQKRVTQAEAAYEEKKLAAEATAFAIEAESVARAEAIEREAKAIKANPQIIDLRVAEKWDGILPKFTGGGVVPFINVDKVTE